MGNEVCAHAKIIAGEDTCCSGADRKNNSSRPIKMNRLRYFDMTMIEQGHPFCYKIKTLKTLLGMRSV